MPGHIHYEREMPEEQYVLDPLDMPVKAGRSCVMTRALFEQIGDYTQSRPTAPSPGRVYKKNLGWRAFVPTWDDRLATDPSLAHCGYREDEPERWWFYRVLDAPADDPKDGQLHHPYRVLLVDDIAKAAA